LPGPLDVNNDCGYYDSVFLRRLESLLFNLYSEAIFQEALEERNVGVKVNGVWVNNIRYADDTVLIADNMEDLRDIVT